MGWLWTGLLAAHIGSLAAIAQQPPCPMHPRFKAPLVFCSIGGNVCNTEDCTISRPGGLALARLVGDDALPDVAVCNTDNLPSISVFRNTGIWTVPQGSQCALEHVSGSPFEIDGLPNEVEAVDIDADNDVDLVVAVTRFGPDSGWLAILRNTGTGTFLPAEYVALESRNADDLVAADFDANGRVDVVVAGTHVAGGLKYPQAELVRQSAPNVFTKTVFSMSTAGYQGRGTAVDKGRLRRPGIAGRLDVVMGIDNTTAPPRMLVLLNDPDAGANIFQKQETNGTTTRWIAVGEIVLDSNSVIASNTDGQLVDVWHADQDGAFPPEFSSRYEIALTIGRAPSGIAIGPLSPDTVPDFVVALFSDTACSSHGAALTFTGLGKVDDPYAYRFCQPPLVHCVDPLGSPKPQHLELADLNQDGLLDVVTSHSESNRFSVLLNDLPIIPGGN
ncbi:MAG: FG-GAP repeat domain-containing protein [Phycisphaerae bacterium]